MCVYDVNLSYKGLIRLSFQVHGWTKKLIAYLYN